MRIRKFFSILAIMLSLTAIASLFLPIYSNNLTDGEACNLIVKGYNLIEFSPWGGVVVVAPFVLLGLMLSKLNDTIKTIALLCLFTLNGVALCGSTSAAYKWICDASTGFVQPHMNHLIYVLLFFGAMVCFYIECNCFSGGNKMKIENVFLKDKKPMVEPVDYRKEKFYLCNKIYDSAKYNENGDVVNDKSTICFATSDGYFAALDDNDTNEYFTVELLEQYGAIGFMMGNMPTGVYGVFYEDYNFRRDFEVDVLTFDHIEKDGALVWILDDDDADGAMGRVVDVQVTANTPEDIRVKILDESDENILGCAVMQGLSLVGFVTEYDAENGEYKCISAEMIAIDLCRKIYEHKVRQAMNDPD